MPEQLNMADLEKEVAETEAQELQDYESGKSDAPIIYRQISGAVEKADAEGPIEFTMSHESEDRMGDIIRADGWELSNFKKNPVMLWAHDNRSAPIGKWSRVRVEGKALVGLGMFDPNDPFAVSIESKVRGGFVNAVSVGFRPIEFETVDGKDKGMFGSYDFKKNELLECSVVPIPAHPKALKKALELAIDGAPDRKRYIFIPGDNPGEFQAKAVEAEEPEEQQVREDADEAQKAAVAFEEISRTVDANTNYFRRGIGGDSDGTNYVTWEFTGTDKFGESVDRFAESVDRLAEIFKQQPSASPVETETGEHDDHKHAAASPQSDQSEELGGVGGWIKHFRQLNQSLRKEVASNG